MVPRRGIFSSMVILIWCSKMLVSYCSLSKPVLLSLFQVKEFDSISRLDQWHTTLLLRIKKTIQGDEGDLK